MTFFTPGTSPCQGVRQAFSPAIPFYLKSVDNIAPSADESKKTRFDFYLLYE